MKNFNNNHLPYHPARFVWIEPFQTIGLETHQNIKLPWKNGIPGEPAKCQMEKIKKNRYQLVKVKRLSRSEQRQSVDCPWFNNCGGCQWLHVSYQVTLHWKEKRLDYLLHKNFPESRQIIYPILGNEQPDTTRFKAVFAVSGYGKNLSIGLYQEHSRQIVNIENCLMVQPEFNASVKLIRQWMSQYNISGFTSHNQPGQMRYLLLQKSWSTSSLSLTLVVTGYNLPALSELIGILKNEFPHLSGINLMLNTDPGNTVISSELKSIYGQPTIEEKLFGISLALYPQSFFQINVGLAVNLFAHLQQIVSELPVFRFAEFYAGSGVIGLILSKIMEEGIGFEVNTEAIKTGQEAVSANKVNNYSLYQTNLEDEKFTELISQLQADPEKLLFIADPPRKGLSEQVIHAVQNTNPAFFIYISCNPDTFFRDMAELQSVGYSLSGLWPYDFFPYTPHIELLGLFKRNT